MNKFPNISRSFTELFNLKRGFKSKKRKKIFTALILSTSIFFLALILLLSVVLFNLLEKRDQIAQQKASFMSQVSFWQNIIVERPDYRDAYFELSILEFKLKDINSSKFYLEKALTLDPNFKQGIEFQKTLNSY